MKSDAPRIGPGSGNAEPLKQAPRCCSGRWWLEFALVMIVFFVAGGAAAPHINETHYLAKAKHYWDPSFCPGDMFLNSAEPHLPFYWTVGVLTKWLSLSATAWVGRVAAWALLAAGWLRLARAITKAPWAGPLSALVWIVLVDKCDFAGEWVVGGLHGKGGVEAKCFAYGFVLFGLAALAAGRWKTPWIWFGAAASMHPLVGGWAVLAGLGAWFAEPRATRPALATLLPGLLLGGLLSLPGLLPALALDRGASAEQADEAARIYVFERLPHHLAPLALPTEEFQRKAVRFGALVVGFAGLAVWAGKNARRATTTVPEPRGGPTDGRGMAFDPQALARIMHFATMALIGNCVGLTIELVFADRPLIAAHWLRYYWFRQADVIVPAAVALCAACLAIHWLNRSWPWARLAIAAATLACTSHLMVIAVDRWQSPYPPALARMQDIDAWLAACDWIREHAPADALCLIPRHAQSFKWYAERADVVNWKDVPQDAVGVIEWRRRIQDVFPTIEGPDGPQVLNSPEQWGTRRALETARRYGAKYIVARSEPPLGLREVFASSSDGIGGGYAIYEVDPADAKGAPASEGAAP